MNIYVSWVGWGEYEDCEDAIPYVGTDFEIAKKQIEEYEFPNSCDNWGTVQEWENGRFIKFYSVI